MELSEALDYARTTRESVLVTLRRNGHPQLSNVLHAVDGDGVVRVSVTAARAKFKNIARRQWAALHVTQPDFRGYAVLEGPAEVSAVAAAPDDAAVEELIALYRSILGEHPDWDEYRAAMVSDQRAVVRLRPDHAYGSFTLAGAD